MPRPPGAPPGPFPPPGPPCGTRHIMAVGPLDNAASCDCEILRNTNAMHLDSLRFVHFDFVCTLRPPQQGGSTDTYKWRQALSMADTARTDTPDATHDSRQLHSFPRQRNKKWTYMDGWTCFALACSCHSQGHRGSRGLCDCAWQHGEDGSEGAIELLQHVTATQCENWCIGFRPGKACLEVQFQSKSLKALADLADSWSERRNKEVRGRKSIIKHYTTTMHLWSLEMNRYVTYVTYCQIMSTAFWLQFYLVIPIFLLGSSCRSGSASWKGSGGRGAGFTMLSWRLRTAECEMQRIERIWKNDEIVMKESIWKMSPWHSATFSKCVFSMTPRVV